MDPKYSDGIYANAEKTVIVLKGVFGYDPHGGEISGPVVATKDDPDTGDLFKQATSKAAPFGAIADYVAPVITVVPVSAPRWKVLIVLNDRGLYDVINNELKKDLENKLEGSFANWQAWNNADRIANDSAIVAGLLSRFPLTNDDVYDIIQEANKISG